MYETKKFNLLELVVVIAIILALVLTGMPKLLGHIQNAQFARDIHDAKVLHLAVEAYYLENGDYPRLNNDPIDLDAVATQFYDLNGNPLDKALATANGEAWYDIDASLLADTVKLNQSSYKFLMQNPVSDVIVVDQKSATEARKTLLSVASTGGGSESGGGEESEMYPYLIDVSTYAVVHEVTTSEELDLALRTATSGHVIAVKGGNYTFTNAGNFSFPEGVDLVGSGSKSNPTVINSVNPFQFTGNNRFYGVVLTGSGHFHDYSSGAYTVFYNSVLDHGKYGNFTGVLGYGLSLYYENCTFVNADANWFYNYNGSYASVQLVSSAMSAPARASSNGSTIPSITSTNGTTTTTIDADYTVAESVGVYHGTYAWRE